MRAPFFSDHMVLQREMPVPVWGTAGPGEEITVLFQGQSRATRAGPDGAWQVKLDPLTAGGPAEMTLRGKSTLVLHDVLVGEVWLCGGQSNMDTPMEFYPNNRDTAAKAQNPKLRFMDMREGARWMACTPFSARGFSATGFYFGRELQRELDIPVGLIESAVGGTALEMWMDTATVAADPQLAADTTAGVLYRAYIAPLIPFALRGVIFYHGESNLGMAPQYRQRFPALIQGWRRAWGMGDFPFLFAQLTSFNPRQVNPARRSHWAEFREAQRLSLGLRHTAMAVTFDIGDALDIHPRNKRDVGLRLALPAKALVYGRKELVWSGPMFTGMGAEGSQVHVRFRHTGGGLVAKGGGRLEGFAVAAREGPYAWAEARIHGDTVSLASKEVAAPVRMRYAWDDNPIGNLYNAEGLPASPFQGEVGP